MNPFANLTPAMIDAHNARVAQRKAEYAKGNQFSEPGKEIPASQSPRTCLKSESDLHDEILEFCRERGWIVFHGSMAHHTHRSVGEPDFQILASGGQTLHIEAKSKTGKMSREQLGLKMMAEKLGHTIYLVRSMADFESILRDKNLL